MSAALRAGVARWVSILLHPFAVFAGVSLAAAWRLEPESLARTAIGMAVAIGVVWGFVLQRQRSGRWGTVDASHPSERPALYALALVVALAYWLWLGGRGSAVAGGILAVVAMLFAASLLNRWIKLSLHVASLAFAAVALWFLWPMAGVAAFVLVPLLGWSRLALGRHRLPEVLGGAALGLVAGIALRQMA